MFVFFKQKTAYEMRISDWSSDVCSSDLADGHLRREQFGAFGRVDAIEAAMLRWRAGDAHMHFGRASIAHHLHDLQAGGAADDRIVDQYDAFDVDQRLVGIVLELDAEVTDLVAGLDEGRHGMMPGVGGEVVRDDL